MDTTDEGRSEKHHEEGMVEYVGFIIIKLISANHLVIGDVFSSDPHVVMKCGSQSVKSKVIYNTLNPIFNETLMLCVSGKDSINFQIWDYDQYKAHDLLGTVHLSKEELGIIIEKNNKEGEGPPLDLILDLDPKGTLHLQISFQKIDH